MEGSRNETRVFLFSHRLLSYILEYPDEIWPVGVEYLHIVQESFEQFTLEIKLRAKITTYK